MASTAFKIISWQRADTLSQDKLQAMVNNDQWLRDNSMRSRYAANHITRDQNVLMLTGIVTIAKSKSANQTRSVSFGGYFSDGCLPLVTTGIISSSQRQIFVTIQGHGSNGQPDRSGFDVHVHVDSNNKKSSITRPFYVSWHALGY